MGTRKKRLSAKRGDIVAIPLADESYGYGQVTEWRQHGLCMVVYTARSMSAVAPEDLGAPVSSLDLTNSPVQEGAWPIVASRLVLLDAPTCPEGVTCGARMASNLLNIYHGIAEPSGHETAEWTYAPLLLPNVDAAVLHDGMLRARNRVPAASHSVPVRQQEASASSVGAVQGGPSEIRIHITCASGAMPSLDDLRVRHEVERQVSEFGDVTDTGAGEGAMDVWLQVSQAERVLSRVREILKSLDVLQRAQVSVQPVSS